MDNIADQAHLNETREKVGDQYFTWSEHFDNWIEFIRPILQVSSEF